MVKRKTSLPNNDMAAQFATDAKKEGKELPSNEKLKQLGEMVNRLATLEDLVSDVLDNLDILNKEMTTLNTQKIPDLFDEFGLSKLSLADGAEVKIQRSYAATITGNNKVECHKWLRKNKFGSLIKHQIVTDLKKGEDKEAKEIMKLTKKLGITYTDKESVHAQTLKAFVKEQIEDGKDFPQELFKVFPIRIAKIKPATF
ncbi:hypothetical protein KAR91_48980 [Candidatus Pacearchaeota archaeon]|nr:hypothetical protein [Candidatus Pacearchaeota archaeon]